MTSKPSDAPIQFVKQQWDIFNAAVVPVGVSDIQRREMRRSFYAGAEAILRITWEIGGESVSEESAMAVIEGMHKEMEEFAAQVLDGKA